VTTFLRRASITPVVPRAVGLLMIGGALSACNAKKAEAPVVGTVVVDRRTIVLDAQATGAIEPINVIEVKSKASGMITRMPVETGSLVKTGDLLVQVDTREMKNQLDQAVADQRSAKASLDVALAQKTRSDELYKTRIITTQEYENAQLAYTQAQGQVVRANTNVDLAEQRMEDARVVAPLSGTIISKPVAEGQVITSATSAMGGGTTLLTMADLSRVRVRALVNETDIGKVRPGQTARVTVDAYPDRPFQGVVEKIEPQALVQQSVTMFPVIVSLDNSEGFLKPGMNGEVSMLVDRRENVVAVSNDAVRTLREAATSAAFVGLNPDTVQAKIREMQAAQAAARAAASGGTAGGGAGRPTTDVPATQSVAMGSTGTGAQGAARGEGAAGAGAGAASGRSASGAAGSGRGASGRGSGAGGGTGRGAGGGTNGGANAAANGAARVPVTRPRSALVYVQVGGKFEPRLVSLGASNYDYSEVLSGLKEGDTVATLAVAALQAKRDQQNERMRQNTTVPGVQRATPAAGGAPGGGAPAGGGGGGGRQGGGGI
jgi:HlyD family secretion protein